MKLEQKRKEFNNKWIELLVNNDENKQREFNDILANSKCETFAIMDYRGLEMKRGRGQDITIDNLKINCDNVRYCTVEESIKQSLKEIKDYEQWKTNFKTLNECIKQWEQWANEVKDELNKYLQNTLQELFLEPIFMGHIDFFIEQAKEKGLSIENALDIVYNRHFENKGRRFLSIALTL